MIRPHGARLSGRVRIETLDWRLTHWSIGGARKGRALVRVLRGLLPRWGF